MQHQLVAARQRFECLEKDLDVHADLDRGGIESFVQGSTGHGRALCQPGEQGATRGMPQPPIPLPPPQFYRRHAPMREWADFTTETGEGGVSTIALSGPLTVSSIGIVDRRLRELDLRFNRIDLSGVTEIDTVGAWTAWRIAW